MHENTTADMERMAVQQGLTQCVAERYKFHLIGTMTFENETYVPYQVFVTDETMFVTDLTNICVHLYEPDGRYLRSVGRHDDTFTRQCLFTALDAALGEDDTLWVTDVPGQRVSAFNTDGETVARFPVRCMGKGWFAPSIYCDRGGRLYIALYQSWPPNDFESIRERHFAMSHPENPQVWEVVDLRSGDGEAIVPTAFCTDDEGNFYLSDVIRANREVGMRIWKYDWQWRLTASRHCMFLGYGELTWMHFDDTSQCLYLADMTQGMVHKMNKQLEPIWSAKGAFGRITQLHMKSGRMYIPDPERKGLCLYRT